MKNNKGYTLIELLVAMAIFAIVMLEIFTMMNQSSKLYLNGTYEVELQTEAQQIVQQMEELLIDANVAVNNVSANTIEIINHGFGYYIDFEPPNPAVNPSVSYGNLFYTSATLDDDGNITGVIDNHVLMAEYVESISLNMAEYTTSSKVTLNVVMNNGKYSYETSKDIYLRNDIGISGNRAGHTVEGDYQDELNILRFKDFNLSNIYGSQYSFQWAAESLANSCSTYYNLRQVGTSWMLETKPSLDTDYSAVGGDYLLEAYDPSDPLDAFVIKIFTNPVTVGSDGYGVFALNGGTASYLHISPVAIDGVYLGAATNVTWTARAIGTDSITDSNEFNNRYNSSFTGTTFDLPTTDVWLTYNGVSYAGFALDGLHGEFDLDTNSIVFKAKGMKYPTAYYGLVERGGIIVLEVVLEYSTIATGNDGDVITFSYPIAVGGAAMSGDEEAAFWNYCNGHRSPSHHS